MNRPYGIFLLGALAVIAVLMALREDGISQNDGTVTESIDTTLPLVPPEVLDALPAEDSDAAASFMEDKSFWKSVRQQAHSLRRTQETQQLPHKTKTALAPVAKSMEAQRAKADAMCRKARHQVATRAGSRDKAARDRALAAALAFCKKVKGVVTLEAARDVAAVAGKHVASAVADTESSADQEKALFRKTIGRQQFTGRGAAKKAKDEAAARELRREATVVTAKDQAKTDAACKAAFDKVKRMPDGIKKQKAMTVAKAFCAKMKKVVANEEAVIKHQVKLTASGADGPMVTKPSALTKRDMNSVTKNPEARAAEACKNALAQANAVLDPTKQVIAQKLAKALCKKVKAVVAKEAHTEKALITKVNAKATDANAKSKFAAKTTPLLATSGRSTGELLAKHKHATSAGHMPGKVAHALQHDIHVLKIQNQADAHKAEMMCEMAKKKVRDDEGATTPAMRAKAVEAALKFCHKTRQMVKHEQEANTNKMDRTVRNDAKKYGLKVMKVDGEVASTSNAHVAVQPSQASVTAEEKLLHKAIGKQADFASDKNALHEAMHEAEHHALKGQVDKMKARINASLATQQKKADLLCKLTKMKIAQLGGAHNAAERNRHLQHALKFCHRAQAVLARERKADFAALERVSGLAHKWRVPVKTKHSHASVTKPHTSRIGQKMKGMGTHSPIRQIEGSVKMRAMAMCKMMHRKVRALGAEKASVRAKALRQAKAFCEKAKALISKEVGLDYAALKKAKAKGLKHKARTRPAIASLTEKAKTTGANAHKEKKRTQKKKSKKMKRSMKRSKIIRAMLPRPKAQKLAAKKRQAARVRKLVHIGQHIKGSVRKHAVIMCKAMQRKVHTLGAAKASVQEMALRQAKAFCKKAKELVAKEVRLDQAALKASKTKAKKLRHMAKSMAEKQRKLMEEEESVKEETKLRQARLHKMAAAKKKIRASEEQKISELNEKRLKRIANAEMKKLKLKRHKIGHQQKKLTSVMKEHLHKAMMTNEHCKSILKNLHAMNHQIAIIDSALSDF